MFGMNVSKTIAVFGTMVSLAFAFDVSEASAATVTLSNLNSGAGALNLTNLSTNGGIDASGQFLFAPISTASGSGAGNCGPGGGICLKFNQNQTTTMKAVGGGAFNLTSLSFVLDGQQAELGVLNLSLGAPGRLIVSVDVGDNYGSLTVAHNKWYDLSFDGAADGVTSILFDNLGRGNVRISNIVASVAPDVAPVPVPAAGLMLLGGLGGLATLRRRRKV